MENDTSNNPQQGAWDTINSYPQKIKFETGKTVRVTFADDFEKPLELPNKDGNGVFYIFNVTSDGTDMAIQTSSFTLLRSLKGCQPLAGKTLDITKKVVNAKNMFYVEVVGANGKPQFEEEEFED